MRKVLFNLDNVLAIPPPDSHKMTPKTILNSQPNHLEASFAGEFWKRYIFTERDEIYKKSTIAWLAENEFDYHKIFFYKPTGIKNDCQNQLECIVGNGVGTYFEHNPYIAMKLKAKSNTDIYVVRSYGIFKIHPVGGIKDV